MPSLELLNSGTHAELRLTRRRDEGRHFAQIVATEFLLAAPYYPIFFTKRPDTGAFYAGVLMGVEPGQNLHAVDGQLPDYRPADLERQGFFVDGDHLVVDREHAVFSDPDGQPLFERDGEPTDALRRVQSAIGKLHQGLEPTDALIARFLDQKLLEPIDISLSFDNGETLRLDGLYTVSLDRLHALPDASVLTMFRCGDLQLAYAQSASVRHLRTLARRRNDSLVNVPR